MTSKVVVVFDFETDGDLAEADVPYYTEAIARFLNDRLNPGEPRIDANYRYMFGEARVTIVRGKVGE